jgi:uncharacterized membrane protein YdfJ with MMPL/SSD domain
MGLGGIAAVVVALAPSLTALPAVLVLLRHRVDAGRVPFLNRRTRARRFSGGAGPWERVAGAVMARPWVYVATIVPALLVLGSPFLRVEFGASTTARSPDGTPSREVAESLLQDFPHAGEPIRVVVRDASPSLTQAYVERLQNRDGVETVTMAGSEGSDTVLDVTHRFDVYSSSAKILVREVRSLDPGAGSAIVTGTTAHLLDVLDSLGEQLPAMGLWVLVSTFVLLFLAMAFGLSMDYEVFLLSRVREQWELTGDNRQAVATGLQRTGGLITSPALLLVVVIGAFSTSGITFIKMIGIGRALAIVIDATVVRGLLVPATKRLLGDRNSWLPAPLARLWSRIGFREHEAWLPVAGPALPAGEVEQTVGAGG